ncbi:MAG: DUF2254 family protein [Methanoregula sp.]
MNAINDIPSNDGDIPPLKDTIDFDGEEEPYKTNHFNNRLQEWELTNLVPARIIIYFSIFFAVFVLGGAFITYLNFTNSNLDSCRYFLSALVQCQAAIISIVISLTLIAVQLTAQKYSFKTVDIFKKDPDLWILLTIYIISITYEFLILKEIDGSPYITEKLGYFVSFAYLLGIFTLLALIPYILNTINLLKSDILISRLIDSISEKNFPKCRVYSDYNPDDPLQPIFDVIHISVKQYDISILDFALKRLLIRMSVILQNDTTIRSSDTVSDYFCENLKRAGLLALDKGDKDIFSIIIDTLEEFGKLKSNSLIGSNTISAINALENLGLYSSEKNYEDVTHLIVDSIYRLGNHGAEKKIRHITSSAISALDQIDSSIIIKSVNFPRSEEIREKIVNDISNIGDEIVRKSDPKIISEERYAICDPVGALNSIGQLRLQYKKYNEISEIIQSIGIIGYYTAAKCTDETIFERSLREVVESLDRLGNLSADYELSSPTSETIKRLGELAEISIENNLCQTTTETFRALNHIYATMKNNKKLEYSLHQFIKSLIQLVFYIRLKKIDSPLSKECELKIINRLKSIKKEKNSVFQDLIVKYRADRFDLYARDCESEIFEKIINEID